MGIRRIGGLIPLGFITVIFISCPGADPSSTPARIKTPAANTPARCFILFLPYALVRSMILQNAGIGFLFLEIFRNIARIAGGNITPLTCSTADDRETAIRKAGRDHEAGLLQGHLYLD